MSVPRAVPHSNLGKGLAALRHCARHPARTLRAAQRGLAALLREDIAARSPIPAITLRELLGPEVAIELCDFAARDGNVSLPELTAIAGVVRMHQPRRLLEIGTFDGNTTLQMALNAAADARVFTLDLPPQQTAQGTLAVADRAYIDDRIKLQRKYARHAAGAKVVQCLGDSATFDFHALISDGPIDLAFVDGSHSYEYVRNDTERVLDVLAADGVVLWHDYTPAWPGVIEYLDALATGMPLRRLAGTSLVLLRRGDRR